MLVAYYKLKIDENMILRAIKTAQIDFLYCVYAYNKNYEEVKPHEDSSSDSDMSDEE